MVIICLYSMRLCGRVDAKVQKAAESAKFSAVLLHYLTSGFAYYAVGCDADFMFAIEVVYGFFEVFLRAGEEHFDKLGR